MSDETARHARHLFESGHYCAESVLLAVAGRRGMNCEAIPRIATGLCGGVARTCGTCGAVLGAILAIGLALGRNGPGDPIDPAYAAVHALLERFSTQYGSTNCLELTACDLGTDEGQALFRDKGQHEMCAEYVETATQLALGATEQQEERQ